MATENITLELCEALSRLTYAEWAQVKTVMESYARRTRERFVEEQLSPAPLGVTGDGLMARFASTDPSVTGSAASERAWRGPT